MQKKNQLGLKKNHLPQKPTMKAPEGAGSKQGTCKKVAPRKNRKDAKSSQHTENAPEEEPKMKTGQKIIIKALVAGIMKMNHGVHGVTSMDGVTKKNMDVPTQIHGKHRTTNGKDGALRIKGMTPGANTTTMLATSTGNPLKQEQDGRRGLRKTKKEHEKEANQLPT